MIECAFTLFSGLPCSAALVMMVTVSCKRYRYKSYLFYGRDREKELSYVSHLEFLRNVFNKLGIISRKKTHAARGSGARDTYDLGYSHTASFLALHKHGKVVCLEALSLQLCFVHMTITYAIIKAVASCVLRHALRQTEVDMLPYYKLFL